MGVLDYWSGGVMENIEIANDQGPLGSCSPLVSVGLLAIVGDKTPPPDLHDTVHPLQLQISPVLQHSITPAPQSNRLPITVVIFDKNL